MVEEIITIFCICDDILREIDYQDNKQVHLRTSEIITTAIVASKYFGGNYCKARMFLAEHHYMSNMISESRFIRRLNTLDHDIWTLILFVLMKGFKESNPTNEYVIDSFPMPVCANVRINRCKIYQDKQYAGFNASKQEYFYGIRVHMLITSKGQPVEFIIEPGSTSDIKMAKKVSFNLVKEAKSLCG